MIESYMCISIRNYDFWSSHGYDYSHCLSLQQLRVQELQSLIMLWYSYQGCHT